MVEEAAPPDPTALPDPNVPIESDVLAVQEALQGLRAGLSGPQAQILDAVMSQAAGGVQSEAAGGMTASIIFVGGRSQSPIVIRFDPAGPISLNPQPIPPGRIGFP
ncbi:hypothetical protein BH10ACT8_BH10ACT8_09180 [soil metagenome]